MKKMLLPVLGILLLVGCEKESTSPAEPAADQIVELRSGCEKEYWICHKDGKSGIYAVLCIDAEGFYGDPDDPDDLGHSGHASDHVLDADGDGFTGPNPCGLGSQDDCDDTDPAVNPGAEEVPYDGVDNDCDPSTPDDDLDGDGFNQADECDDTDPAVNPDADEVPYDGVDNDCDPSTPDDDLDGDGFLNANDCDDNNAAVNPGATEICDNAIDDDCDGDVDEADSDCSTSCVPEGIGEELEVMVNGPSGPYTLYVYPVDNSTAIQWSFDGGGIEAYDIWDGDANTDAIVANQGAGTNYAAGLCNSLKTDGCDWYLPSWNELVAIYQQLGPVENGGSGDMDGEYWSSFNAGDGIWAMPEDGTGNINSTESGNFSCRCVRR